MASFAWGFVSGTLITLLAATGAAVLAYRRVERLRQRAKQAERLAELGTLTGGLAHEIKNPLSTVQLNLQLLREDVQPDTPAARRLYNRLSICERETIRLRDILDDFLRYAGKIELDRKPVSLHQLCEDLVDFFLPQAQFQKAHLRLKPPEEEVIVLADERLLKQAVLNLLLNGLQAMPNGGELMLQISKDPQEARIDVIDTGSGISPENTARIFDAYYSTKKSGTGLGLAMTRRIAEEHGGRVSVASELGKGSSFTLHLPVT